MLVGYAHVSTQDQDLTVQRERLAHCEKLFAETASGTDTKRVQLDACLDYVREGDTLVVTRLDRLARSTLHLYQIADGLAKKGVHLQILDQALDTHTETGRLLFGMLAVIAQFETELRAERQREGIAKAQRKGTHFGRTKALTAVQVGRDRTAARATSTFPQAPLRSRTVGFPEDGSAPGFPLEAFRNTRKLKRWLAYTPLLSRLPSGSSEKTGSSDTRR